MRSGPRFLAVGIAIAAAGCTLDDVMHAVPWFGSMIEQPSIRPYAMPRATPDSVVPVTGTEPAWQFPTGDLTFVNALENPRPPTDSSIARGRELYDIYCALCHGPTGGTAAGLGDGPVAQRMPGVLSVISPQAGAYSDGYLYSIIRYGRGLMPRYGDKVRSIGDRWDVVNYVRQLQTQARETGVVGQ